jgi:hypothetical protein
MSSGSSRLLLALLSLLISLAATASVAQAPASVPKIWDDAALADWATPIGGASNSSGALQTG